MRAQRLRRLSLLTQGVALITLAGCQKEGASEPPHVNAPAPAPTTTGAPVVASASASVAEPEPPTTNAPIQPKPPKTNSPK